MTDGYQNGEQINLPKVADNLANNLIALRKKRKLSQQALSIKSLVPRSTIALLESGQSNPTLSVIIAISEALNISVDELLLPPRGEYKLIKAEHVPCQKSADGSVSLFKLLPDAIMGIEIDRIELKPQAKKRGVPHLENTKEYLTCMRGHVTLYVDHRAFQLSAGDVLAFPGDKPHSYFNHGDTEAICFSVVIPVAELS